jgi:hypothetical protein
MPPLARAFLKFPTSSTLNGSSGTNSFSVEG